MCVCACVCESRICMCLILILFNFFSVASLALVSAGAATDGVAPIFSSTTDNLFYSSVLRCHPYFSLKNWRPFFDHHRQFFMISLGCHPLEGVTPDLFLPLRPRFSTILCKFSHNKFFFIQVSPPLEGVIRGGPPLWRHCLFFRKTTSVTRVVSGYTGVFLEFCLWVMMFCVNSCVIHCARVSVLSSSLIPVWSSSVTTPFVFKHWPRWPWLDSLATE